MQLRKFVILISILTIAQCLSFDDGRYKPKNYDTHDDGKYYRPLDEGKYVPGDEGRYTYIYQRGAYPYDGTYTHLGRGDSNEYIGLQIYAPRFPFLHRIIKAYIRKYVSPDIGGADISWTANNIEKVKLPEEVAVKCKVIEAESKNNTETVTQYPPYLNLKEGEKLGQYYNFKGTKVLSTQSSSLKNKLKLQYEVFVRIVEDESK